MSKSIKFALLATEFHITHKVGYLIILCICEIT